MRANTKTKRRARPEVQQPPAPLTVERVTEADPDGRAVQHHRVVDTLGKMLRAGTITTEMHEAAADFHTAFSSAKFDRVMTMQLMRIRGSGSAAEMVDGQIDARRRVFEAIDALGGLSSPAGSCVWHVVGMRCSVREWAMRQGWNGRQVDRDQAVGVLVAALAILAQHFRRG